MQVRLYETNDIKDKLKTRPLYEECFDEGKNDYIDYYYNAIIKRNAMMVMEDDGKVVSMIHLNPYRYNIDGEIKNVHYLVAVATDREYRNKGIMAKVLKNAIEYLKSLKEPFCYIVPESATLESMYQKFGFEKVCRFTYNKFSKERYDIFPEQNEEYVRLMEIEQKYLDMETEEYKEDLKKKNVMIRILDEEFKYSIDDLRKKSIYVCQEV